MQLNLNIFKWSFLVIFSYIQIAGAVIQGPSFLDKKQLDEIFFWHALTPRERQINRVYNRLQSNIFFNLEMPSCPYHFGPFERDLISKLSGYKIVFVQGLLTDLYRFASACLEKSHLPIKTGPFISFQDQIDWFERLGLDVAVVRIHSQETMEHNGKIIAKVIAGSPKKSIIITHSKGGVDVLSALVNNPQLWGKVRGWASFQTPFDGTPFIDEMIKKPVTSLPYRLISKFKGGTFDSFKDLSEEHMQEFNLIHAETIQQLKRMVPILPVAVSSPYLNDSDFSTKSSLIRYGKEINRQLDERGLVHKGNDGLVPTDSACLEGIDNLILREGDHTSVAVGLKPFQDKGANHRKASVAAALLMLLQK